MSHSSTTRRGRSPGARWRSTVASPPWRTACPQRAGRGASWPRRAGDEPAGPAQRAPQAQVGHEPAGLGVLLRRVGGEVLGAQVLGARPAHRDDLALGLRRRRPRAGASPASSPASRASVIGIVSSGPGRAASGTGMPKQRGEDRVVGREVVGLGHEHGPARPVAVGQRRGARAPRAPRRSAAPATASAPHTGPAQRRAEAGRRRGTQVGRRTARRLRRRRGSGAVVGRVGHGARRRRRRSRGPLDRGLDQRRRAPGPATRSWSSWYLRSAPSVSARPSASQLVAAERHERLGPVERLGHARRLHELEVADALHERRDLAGQALGRRRAAGCARSRPRARGRGGRSSGRGTGA